MLLKIPRVTSASCSELACYSSPHPVLSFHITLYTLCNCSLSLLPTGSKLPEGMAAPALLLLLVKLGPNSGHTVSGQLIPFLSKVFKGQEATCSCTLERWGPRRLTSHSSQLGRAVPPLWASVSLFVMEGFSYMVLMSLSTLLIWYSTNLWFFELCNRGGNQNQISYIWSMVQFNNCLEDLFSPVGKWTWKWDAHLECKFAKKDESWKRKWREKTTRTEWISVQVHKLDRVNSVAFQCS